MIAKIFQAAFTWVNPLSMRYLRNKRAHYYTVVKAELEEVEAVRRSYHAAKESSGGQGEVLHSLPDHHTPDSTDDEEDDHKENDQDTPPGDVAQNGSTQLPEGEQNGSGPHLNEAQNGLSHSEAEQNELQVDTSPEQDAAHPDPGFEETGL
ncbi:hypothetical protein Pmani_027364 [Petrolisthes manimaculis]|uniref:Uncharacterized protein n=1 Tax=Petrolisthes manimaculis TaxID=1843537 RepID=A0AAE1TVT7_9EUCA|nr:hypothetical protein Pmani_027364 [Petrolisthes manimaculis]